MEEWHHINANHVKKHWETHHGWRRQRHSAIIAEAKDILPENVPAPKEAASMGTVRRNPMHKEREEEKDSKGKQIRVKEVGKEDSSHIKGRVMPRKPNMEERTISHNSKEQYRSEDPIT